MLFSATKYRNHLLLLASMLFGMVALAKEDPDPSKAIMSRLQKAYNGKVIMSADTFPKTIDADLEKFLKDKSKKDAYTLTPDGKNLWIMNTMSFLNKDPGGADLTMVFYDKDNKESQKNLEPIQNVDLKSTKGQKLIIVPNITLSENAGFVVGKTYIVKITQLKAGKEISLAEALIKLDPAEIK